MQQYLNMLQKIHYNLEAKQPTRDGAPTVNSTYSHRPMFFEHNLADGFPLLTTRKLNWRGCVGELRSFLEGKMTQDAFALNGCHFWKQWMKNDGSFGPIYGVQWNRFNQLGSLLWKLRNQPYDRRMVVSAWFPDQIPEMALPPCHVIWGVNVVRDTLHLSFWQRSADVPIGVPYNIASYGLLTHILAAWARLKPGWVSGTFVDPHIYHNQIDGVMVQLRRKPKHHPNVHVTFENEDFNSWKVDLTGYSPLPNINFGDIEV